MRKPREAHGRGGEMSLSTAALFGAAALITTVGLVLPHAPEVDVAGLIVLVAVAAVVAGALLWRRERIPASAYPLVAVVGTLLVSLGLYSNGERDGGPVGSDEMFYLWVVLWAAYYFSRRVLAVQVAIVLAAYTVTLVAIHPGDAGMSRWVSLSGLIVGAALVVRLLSERGERLLAELRLAALTDPLTNLPNRRALEAAFGRETDQHARAGRPFALLVLDIDRFKQLNDRQGHKAGDRALVEVADLLRAQVRETDTAARIGGDEFALLLSDTDGSTAAQALGRLERSMHDHARIEGWPGAASVGLSVAGIDGTTMDELMRHADMRLYAAKRVVHGTMPDPRMPRAS